MITSITPRYDVALLVFFVMPFVAQARNAIAQLTDTELMGRPILIREDRGDGPSQGRGVGGGAGARVFVGNLSWQVAWQDLKDCMRQVSLQGTEYGN